MKRMSISSISSFARSRPFALNLSVAPTFHRARSGRSDAEISLANRSSSSRCQKGGTEGSLSRSEAQKMNRKPGARSDPYRSGRRSRRENRRSSTAPSGVAPPVMRYASASISAQPLRSQWSVARTRIMCVPGISDDAGRARPVPSRPCRSECHAIASPASGPSSGSSTIASRASSSALSSQTGPGASFSRTDGARFGDQVIPISGAVERVESWAHASAFIRYEVVTVSAGSHLSVHGPTSRSQTTLPAERMPSLIGVAPSTRRMHRTVSARDSPSRGAIHEIERGEASGS